MFNSLYTHGINWEWLWMRNYQTHKPTHRVASKGSIVWETTQRTQTDRHTNLTPLWQVRECSSEPAETAATGGGSEPRGRHWGRRWRRPFCVCLFPVTKKKKKELPLSHSERRRLSAKRRRKSPQVAVCWLVSRPPTLAAYQPITPPGSVWSESSSSSSRSGWWVLKKLVQKS